MVRSKGYVFLDAIVRIPATPADEADAAITVNIRDVRSAGDLSDYPFSLTMPLPLRLTYRGANGDQTSVPPPRRQRAVRGAGPVRPLSAGSSLSQSSVRLSWQTARSSVHSSVRTERNADDLSEPQDA